MSIRTLHIGRTGLKTASYGMDVTGQSVTNASTEGGMSGVVSFSRRAYRIGTSTAYSRVRVSPPPRFIETSIGSRPNGASSHWVKSMASTAHESLSVVEAKISGRGHRSDCGPSRPLL